jgi:hypothetical protein
MDFGPIVPKKIEILVKWQMCTHYLVNSRTFQPYQKQSEGPFYSNMVISKQTPNVINM